MKIGFDLDGCLDRKPVRDLALALLDAGHEIHVITGCFDEAGEWQAWPSKMRKLVSYGFADQISSKPDAFVYKPGVYVELIHAMDGEKYDRDYRLVDLGLRKGDYVRRHGIEIMFDDSEKYIGVMPSMCGAQMMRVMP